MWNLFSGVLGGEDGWHGHSPGRLPTGRAPPPLGQTARMHMNPVLLDNITNH